VGYPRNLEAEEGYPGHSLKGQEADADHPSSVGRYLVNPTADVGCTCCKVVSSPGVTSLLKKSRFHICTPDLGQ
jgi:hypothetical protein